MKIPYRHFLMIHDERKGYIMKWNDTHWHERYSVLSSSALVGWKPRINQAERHVCAHVAIRDLRNLGTANCSFYDLYRCLLRAYCARCHYFHRRANFCRKSVVYTACRLEMRLKVSFDSRACAHERVQRDNATCSRSLRAIIMDATLNIIFISFFYRNEGEVIAVKIARLYQLCQVLRNFDI